MLLTCSLRHEHARDAGDTQNQRPISGFFGLLNLLGKTASSMLLHFPHAQVCQDFVLGMLATPQTSRVKMVGQVLLLCK
jgi:hypothetical protein